MKGLMDTDDEIDLDANEQDILAKDIIKMTHDIGETGIHAFILVITLGRIHASDASMVQHILDNFFSEEMRKRVIVVITKATGILLIIED